MFLEFRAAGSSTRVSQVTLHQLHLTAKGLNCLALGAALPRATRGQQTGEKEQIEENKPDEEDIEVILLRKKALPSSKNRLEMLCTAQHSTAQQQNWSSRHKAPV